MSYKAHLFICTNEKAGKCGDKGGDQLRKQLKDRCKDAFGKDVRVTASGCLGECKHTVTAVLYPEGKWFYELKKKDNDVLFEAIEKSLDQK